MSTVQPQFLSVATHDEVGKPPMCIIAPDNCALGEEHERSRMTRGRPAMFQTSTSKEYRMRRLGIVRTSLALCLAAAMTIGGRSFAADLSAARDNFDTQCAKCQGEQGRGDGPAGAALPTKPRNFSDCTRMAKESDQRLFNAIKELSRVSRQGLNVAPLTFSVNGVKSKRGLARSGDPGHYRQGVVRDLKVNVLQIMDAGATHNDAFSRHRIIRKGGAASSFVGTSQELPQQLPNLSIIRESDGARCPPL